MFVCLACTFTHFDIEVVSVLPIPAPCWQARSHLGQPVQHISRDISAQVSTTSSLRSDHTGRAKIASRAYSTGTCQKHWSLWNRIFDSMELHQQEFAPIESRIQLRGLGGGVDKPNDNLQGNEWAGEHRAPEPYAVLKGEGGSAKLEGQEWAQSLGGPPRSSGDETNSPTGNLTVRMDGTFEGA